MSFLTDEEVDALCEEIADGAVNSAIDVMYGMCGNNGQEAIIGNCEDEFSDQVDDIADGDFEEVESDHPEAVSQITDAGNEICAAAAAMCDEIRKAAEAL